MKTFTRKSEIQEFIALNANKNQSIGFVPTMGALHNGHLSLLNKSKAQNDLSICSIFVNPTQFNNSDDLAKYPRTLAADSRMLEKAHCDVLFAPSAEEMYQINESFDYEPSTIAHSLEGEFRPGHFKGVAQIVFKLFSLIKPNKAYFGLKDYQQLLVIEQMVKDLKLDIDIIPCPILREENGLAMSSRNERLKPEDRASAKRIYETLCLIKQKARENTKADAIIKEAISFLQVDPRMELEYLRLVNKTTLNPFPEIILRKEAIALIAVNYGGVRLIDNLLLD